MAWPLSADEKEASDFRNAVEQSLQDERAREERARQTLAQEDQEELAEYQDKAEEVPAAPYDPLKAMTENIDLRLGNEFSPLLDPNGDTLIYIGIPPRSPDQSREEYAHISKHFDRFFIVQSAAIKALESSKLDNLFRPNACIRAEKRFKKLDAYCKLNSSIKSQIKFHIDLRPPNEDDEAVLLITDLTCSRGILAWHLAQDTYGLAQHAVGGTDHLDYPSNPYYIDLRRAREGPLRKKETPLAAEYCPLRHHSGLERLINAIAGNDPKLDSAPKMWTFFALANYFGCANVDVVRKWLQVWSNEPGNANFLQNNPENAYRIGLGCQIPDLARDAFAILVGEKALSDVSHQLFGTVSSSPYSVHGRPLEILDDDERNRIGHAASSLIQRVRSVLDDTFVKADWLNESQEFRYLMSVRTPDAARQQIVQDAQQGVIDYVKYRLTSILTKTLTGVFEGLHGSNSSDKLPHAKHTLSFVKTYNELSILARPFTRSFWMAVLNVDLAQDQDLYMSTMESWTSPKSLEDQNLQGLGDALRKPNLAFTIDRKIQMVNDLIHSSQWDPLSTPPQQRYVFGATSYPQGNWNDGYQQSLAESKYSTASASDSQALLQHKGEQGSGTEAPTSPGKRRKISNEGPFQLPFRPALPLPPQLDEEQAPAPPSQSHFGTYSEPEKNVKPSFMSRINSMMPAPWTQPSVRAPPVSQNYATHKTSEERAAVGGFSDSPAPKPVDESFSTDNLAVDDVFSEISQDHRPAVAPWPPHHMPEPEQPASVPFGWQNYLDNRAKEDHRAKEPMVPFTAPSPGFSALSESGPPVPGTADRALADKLHDSPNGLAVQDSSNRAAFRQTPSKRRAVQQFSNTNTGPWEIQRYATGPAPRKHVDFRTMMTQLNQIVQRRAQELVYPAHIFNSTNSLPIGLVDHVFCLTDDEWKYLPLTVGGFDDGTGGVFDEAIPNLEAGGFRGGKRGIGKVDATSEDSESGSSSFDDIGSEAISTVGKASKLATDGTETVKSYENAESDGGFDYTDLYGEVQQLKIEEALNDVNVTGVHDADHDGGDVSTIMGGDSDVQGQFFGDDDDEDVLGEDTSLDESEEESSREKKGKYAAQVKNESDEDEDLEIIDMERL